MQDKSSIREKYLDDESLMQNLRKELHGKLVMPGEDSYDALRTVFIGSFNRKPALIVRPADAHDVALVVGLARKTSLELAIRSGGHSAAGHSATEGGILMDLRDMRSLEIDVEHRTAWAGSGLTAGEFTKAAAAYGLAVGFGDTGSVGIGGLTLGGGVGYLVRKYGLTIDNLLGAEIVTADGQVRYIDAENEPELFWAIRGGGGNFGVVTRFKFRLHEMSEVYGGMLILPATPQTITAFLAQAEAAPDELSTIANVMSAPPMPFLPKEVHGKLVVMAMLVYAGSPQNGERAVAPFRAIAKPLVDMVRPMRYPEIYQPEDENYHPISVARSLFVDAIDEQTAGRILEHLRASTAMMAAAQLRVLGGAAARVPADATAYAHRSRKIMVAVAALFGRAEEAGVHEPWVVDFAAALRQGDSGVYVNFLSDEGLERVREAYPGKTWERLAAVKAMYDPVNLFRLNQNIR